MPRPLPWLVAFASMAVGCSQAATDQLDVRGTFEQFVAFQNQHDAKGVESLLFDSPQFLWITRGEPVWGRKAAIERFEMLYRDIWRLEPVSSEFRMVVDGDYVAQIYVPVVFTIGKEGQPPVVNRFLMNQTLVKTPDGWRIASILPIPAAEPVPEAPTPPK